MRVIFSNVMAIYRKELQGYFTAPLFYAIAAVFWLLTGYFLIVTLLGAIDYAYYFEQLDNTRVIDVASKFQQDFLSVLGNLALFVLPILSMGLYAEERKRGTLELLSTSPLTNWSVATGKLLGAVTFFMALIAPLIGFEAFILSTADPVVSPIFTLIGHLGLFLLAASILAIGLFISSLTDNTIWAAVFTFAFVVFLWLIGFIADGIGGTWGQVLGHLSLLNHYSNLLRGVFDISSLILFGSYIFLGIFLTAQSIEALRFQRS